MSGCPTPNRSFGPSGPQGGIGRGRQRLGGMSVVARTGGGREVSEIGAGIASPTYRGEDRPGVAI